MAPSSSSEIRHWQERVVNSRDELESSLDGLIAALARENRENRELHERYEHLQDEYTRAQYTITDLQDEIARLRDSSSTDLQEEMTRLRERITRLERGGQRKHEGRHPRMQSEVRRR